MLKDITIGQYYPANSKIHKLDPRTKIIAAIIFMIALFVVNQFWPYIIIFGIIAAVVKASDIQIHDEGVKTSKMDSIIHICN